MSEISMSLEEFRQKTSENPEGFQFSIKCLKCDSTEVNIDVNGSAYGGGGGCETCGYGGEGDAEVTILFKCMSCGCAYKETRTTEKDFEELLE